MCSAPRHAAGAPIASGLTPWADAVGALWGSPLQGLRVSFDADPSPLPTPERRSFLAISGVNYKFVPSGTNNSGAASTRWVQVKSKRAPR
jgi:hypothetical protein